MDEFYGKSLFWGLIASGGGLIGMSMAHYLRRSDNGLLSQEEGVPIRGDSALRIDQQVLILPIRDPRAEALAHAKTGYITHIRRGCLRIQLESQEHSREHNHFQRGVPMRVEFTGGDALYAFETRILDHTLVRPDSHQRELTLARPRWMTRLQRRKHPRTPLRLPATFETLPTEPGTRPTHATLYNLSSGGFAATVGGVQGPRATAELLQRLKIGRYVSIRTDIPELPDRLLARIQTCERIVVRGGLSVRIGCAFVSMPATHKERLLLYLLSLQNAPLENRIEIAQSHAV